MKRILNCIPSTKREHDWEMDSAVESGMVAAAAPPPSKDLRASWWPIGNQGSTGSCVGWAAADSVVRYAFATAGRIPMAKDAKLSVRFTWMASKETDEFTSRPTSFIESDGTSLKAALDIARRYGSVRSDVLPFDPPDLYGGSAGAFYTLAAQLRITSYVTLRPVSGITAAALVKLWKAWIANGGAILTRLDVDQTWDDVGTDGKLNTYKPATTRGGHAVALVGYTPDRFIVRNSWGTGWGDKGFAYASNAYAVAAFSEAYGVTV